MAIKAICTINGTIGRYAADHTKFYVGVTYAALDDSDPAIAGDTYLYGITPGVLSSITDSIQSQMKDYLTTQGVTFGLLDTVQLI